MGGMIGFFAAAGLACSFWPTSSSWDASPWQATAHCEDQQSDEDLGDSGVYSFTVRDLDGADVALSDYARDYPVVLVVNVATQ